MAKPGVPIEIPGVPDGPDEDLDVEVAGGKGRSVDDEQGSPAKRSRAQGSGAEVLTMDSLRQLLAEQSVSLLQAQQVQIGASLRAFEDRQAVRLEGIETTVQNQGTAVASMETQVKELAVRVAKVEGQPAPGHGGPDRRHTLARLWRLTSGYQERGASQAAGSGRGGLGLTVVS